MGCDSSPVIRSIAGSSRARGELEVGCQPAPAFLSDKASGGDDESYGNEHCDNEPEDPINRKGPATFKAEVNTS